MSNDRVRNIIRHYRTGLYSFEMARREIVALGLTPEEAGNALALITPKSAVERSGVSPEKSP